MLHDISNVSVIDQFNSFQLCAIKLIIILLSLNNYVHSLYVHIKLKIVLFCVQLLIF